MTDPFQPPASPAGVGSQPAPLLLPGWSAELTTQSGMKLLIRPAAIEDETRLADIFTHVAPEDVRFRFLSAVHTVGHEMLKTLVEVNHGTTENFLVFAEDGETLVATAMLAADESMERAEVAIAIRSDFKHKGVGWTLLDHVADYAAQRGIGAIESIECRDNLEAISLEKEMGFAASPCLGDTTLVVLRKTLPSR